MLAGALAANFFFMPPRFEWALTSQDLAASSLFCLVCGLMIAAAEALRSSARQLGVAAERERALNDELAHRVKNNLAVVQGIARVTAKSSASPDDFYDAFSGRLLALSEAHSQLNTGGWLACEVQALAHAAVLPFRGEGNITLAGPKLLIPPASCQPLTLALHELATNAVKYGALSVRGGSVELAWSRGEDRRLKLLWRERGGPAVQPPTRCGLGSRVLTAQPGLELVELRFDASGVVCRIEIDGADEVQETGA
jgi:two-component sensor histidine kinase